MSEGECYVHTCKHTYSNLQNGKAEAVIYTTKLFFSSQKDSLQWVFCQKKMSEQGAVQHCLKAEWKCLSTTTENNNGGISKT